VQDVETDESDDDLQDAGEDESMKHVNGHMKGTKASDDATGEEIEVAIQQPIKLQIPGTEWVKQDVGRIVSSSPNTPTRRSTRNSRRASG
jgi:hypothetical protein